MKILALFTRRVARSLLRGPALDWWLRRIAARLSQAYSRLLLGRLARPADATVATISRPPLRAVLFICDNMWERRELLPELEKICTVEFIDVGRWKIAGPRVADERLDVPAVLRALDPLRARSFDAIMVYLNSALLAEELVVFLRATWSCALFGLNLDDKTTYAPYGILKSSADDYARWAGRFDVNLTNSRAMADVYRADGFPCLYLPTGFHFDPAKSGDLSPQAFSYPLSFVGSRKPERAQFIDELKVRGIKVALFGTGWPGARFTDDGWRVFRESQLNLGIGFNLPGTQFTNLKNRDFECPGSGGCYVTTYDWELAELYVIGREILCYRNLDEFVEIYTYYMRRPEACREIAREGLVRATREHTWEQRFRRVFTELGFA